MGMEDRLGASCYVADLLEGIMRLAGAGEHMPTNIGNPPEFAILECAQLILEVTGSSGELRFLPLPQDDPARRKPDIDKARELLNWEPRVNLREGLFLSLDYFRQALESKVAARDAHRSAELAGVRRAPNSASGSALPAGFCRLIGSEGTLSVTDPDPLRSRRTT